MTILDGDRLVVLPRGRLRLMRLRALPLAVCRRDGTMIVTTIRDLTIEPDGSVRLYRNEDALP